MKATWGVIPLAAVLLAACGGSSTSPGEFTVSVLPTEDPVAVRAAIPGEKTNFLVTIQDAASANSAASVTAKATNATVRGVQPVFIKAGQVAEVWLTIDPGITLDTTASVSITVSRAGVSHTVDRTIQVMPMSGEGRDRDAQPHFALWTRWLEANHPELGITSATSWEPLYVSPLLIVSHMAYYSNDWEMGLMWHAATIPPNDWSQIYLRKRHAETKPSLSFKLDSFSGETAPYSVPPPEVVVR